MKLMLSVRQNHGAATVRTLCSCSEQALCKCGTGYSFILLSSEKTPLLLLSAMLPRQQPQDSCCSAVALATVSCDQSCMQNDWSHDTVDFLNRDCDKQLISPNLFLCLNLPSSFTSAQMNVFEVSAAAATRRSGSPAGIKPNSFPAGRLQDTFRFSHFPWSPVEETN